MRIPLLAAVLLPLFTLFVDVYLYVSIRRKRGARDWTTITYGFSALLCWCALAVILISPRRSADGDIMAIMWALYAYISVYIAKFAIVLFSLIGLIPVIFDKKKWRLGLFVGLPLGLIIFFTLCYGALIGRYEMGVKRVSVRSEKLPDAFDGYTIVQFSDAHVGTWGCDTVFVSRLVDSINALRPDLIAFTGDLVNRKTDEVRPFINVLKRLKARDGVVSVLGNHDYGDYITWNSPEEKKANLDSLKVLQRRLGWKMLNNEHLFVHRGNDSIAVIGVENWGEPPFAAYGDISKAYPSSPEKLYHINDHNFKILLSHNPEHWNRHISKETNIDLTLSGHTHAMQLILSLGSWRWSPSQYIYQQWGGMYDRKTDKGETVRIYVNIGCGEVGMPYRIFAPSEITEITLKR